jgi:hypothetical protein
VAMDVAADAYLLTKSSAGRDPIHCPAPESSIVDSHSYMGRARIPDILVIAALLCRFRRSLASKPFEHVFAHMERLSQSWLLEDPPARASAVALRFLSARRLLPFAPLCLPDSLTLMQFLAWHRTEGTLVFGVKLDPFAAHCWVQAGDVVLNDRLDRVQRFAPVRTVPCLPATH